MLVALAAGLYVLVADFDRPQRATQNMASGQTASSFFNGVELYIYDARGQLLSRLQGHSLKHRFGGELQMEAVNAQHFSSAGIPTSVQSDVGNIDDKELLLSGNVFVVKKNLQGKMVETLRTSDLLVDHLGKSAKTENKAVLKRGTHVLEGVGATVDFETGKFRLLSSVRLTLSPNG